jgi:hypothetical protein
MFNSFHVSPELQSILDQELEAEIKPRFPTGIELTMNGKCPKGATSAAACMLCDQGHLLECHFGMSCKEAQCSHYLKYPDEQ